ncbi:MAG: TIR domain protein [Candidatus Methanoperedens nitroreducens]|uniref:TIR domain protein n=1 Tax=Candidatus Methanoperedens nitratireducens TaxID=1392998 RepID=A0A0P7ZBW1_9EURY|nr:toll/interleukin-1 receptor domain-containing protein [Candidatus Methanoperedens sp. BLZ2]KAB2946093.1 MAG: toll/interleukin-1 receptor domain-containing protein [Candidatus Methanoperedens sp.]KPQ42078.1 MAG: TIR domain protein [Candidatus Methanoperedens sp. BLZ1]MBZ0175035.1 toll/interleukin-1 receptor domain-containing protein [Candidatus Methanoperedens nitroreducens]MCX9076654.1 toll/interleukin-1 receptor domain-containing protein [Candidatus Methanoperedens sp.]
MDSFRIFFSYSTDDKTIVGKLKEQLEFMGFEVFLAHDDIEPNIEWQYDIIKNIKGCDTFIPLLTKSFRESAWTDQEIGMAVATDKFIVALQVDFPPYGFLGKNQGLRIKLSDIIKDNPENVKRAFKYYAEKIAKVIINKFGENMKSFVINNFIRSKDFYQANARAKLLEFFPDYTAEQANQVLIATIDNTKIYYGYTAKIELTKFFKKYRGVLNLTEDGIINIWSE